MTFKPRSRRILGLLGVALSLALLADVRPVEATCGGGGGGGMGGGSSSSSSGTGSGPSYSTDWTSSLDDALSKASMGKKALVLYFMPENAKESHPLFRTKMLQEMSKDTPVLQFPYNKDNPLRVEFKVPKDQHIIHVCDWYANSMKGFTAPTLKHQFPYPSIEAVVSQIRKTVDALLKKFENNLKSAEAKLEKDPSDALKALGDLVTFKGHEIVERAKPVIVKITAAAEKEIVEAMKLEDKKARAKEFQKIKGRYKALEAIQDRCDKEIEAATGRAPARESDSALARADVASVIDPVVAAAESPSRTLSIAELSYRAMCEGLRCELREEYEKAMEHYALAAGLDPRDSIALTYLGELYRHHLGRWDDARRAFERVVELNNSDLAMAVSLHGLGKMTIWEGNNEAGLKLFEQSLKRKPTALCYRNLAVFWNTENEFKKAFGFATQAYDLDPADAYNQVFYAIYLILDGQKARGDELIKKAQYDPSMAYNYACYHAAEGRHELVFKYLHRHFYGYEKFDDVRKFEMAEARMDIHFKAYKQDPKFLELTALAAK